MTIAFDLISDLHVESWGQFDWSGQATSPVCVVAGDVAKDHAVLQHTLEHLTGCYQNVLYIDGNEEHKNYWDSIGENYNNFFQISQNTSGLVFLQNNVVITNGVAFLGTNAWWTWDFEPEVDIHQLQNWFVNQQQCNSYVPALISELAINDANYMISSVKRLQTFVDVKQIVVVTHTVPSINLVNHDPELVSSYRINTMGNSLMQQVLAADTEHKIKTWCFGHYHGSVDRMLNGVRYVNNCRGRKDTDWHQSVYYPRRIEIEI